MADDLRSTIEAAVAQTTAASEKPDAAAAPAAPAPSPAPAPAPAVDKPTFDAETGKEVTDQKGSEQKPEPPKDGSPTEVTETPMEKQEKEPAPQGRLDKPPQSWKASEKGKWNGLDIGVRAEIIRREREADRAIQESSGARKFAEGFERAVQPYMGRYQAAGLKPTQAIMNLMQVDHALATGPAPQRAQLMAKMITDYGVDIEMLANALDGKDMRSPTADVEQLLEQKLAPVQEFIQGQTRREQEQRQREFQATAQTIEQMAEDPAYPLFEVVREDMADIIEINLKRGTKMSLKEVYNRAVQMNPEASAETQRQAKQSQAQKANDEANRATAASLSVSGNPASLPTQVPASDLRGTIEAAFAAARGR